MAQKLETINNFQLKQRRILKGHQGKVLALDWCSDKRHIASTSQDGKLVIWDGFSTNKEHLITMPTTWVMTCAYAPSGNFVTCGGLDNKITLYKITAEEDMSKQKRVIANHTNYISCNKFMYSDQQVKRRAVLFETPLWHLMSWILFFEAVYGKWGQHMQAMGCWDGTADANVSWTPGGCHVHWHIALRGRKYISIWSELFNKNSYWKFTWKFFQSFTDLPLSNFIILNWHFSLKTDLL